MIPWSALKDAVLFLWRYERLKVRIDAREAAVLNELKEADELREGGLTPAQLSERLAVTEPPPVTEVRALLTALVAKGNEDVTLVTSDGNDHWRIGNV